jgi:hypothetical protein
MALAAPSSAEECLVSCPCLSFRPAGTEMGLLFGDSPEQAIFSKEQGLGQRLLVLKLRRPKKKISL